VVGGNLIEKGNRYLNPGDELLRRSSNQIEESIYGRPWKFLRFFRTEMKHHLC